MARLPNAILVAGVAESSDLPGLSAPMQCLPTQYIAELALDGSAILHTELLDRSPQAAGPRLTRQADAFAVSSGSELLSVDFDADADPIACVTESATLSRTDTVAPGSLLSLFGANLAAEALIGRPHDDGRLPTSLGGASVEINAQAAPLLYVSPSQINVQVPLDTIAGETAELQLAESPSPRRLTVETRRPTAFLSPVQQPLCPTISLFAYNAGFFPLALLADGSVLSCDNPALAGSTVTIFLSGLGTTEPPQVTGSIAGAEPVPLSLPITFDPDRGVEVVSATTLPGSISSVWRVELRMPDNARGLLELFPVIDGVPVTPPRLNFWVTR